MVLGRAERWVGREGEATEWGREMRGVDDDEGIEDTARDIKRRARRPTGCPVVTRGPNLSPRERLSDSNTLPAPAPPSLLCPHPSADMLCVDCVYSLRCVLRLYCSAPRQKVQETWLEGKEAS